MIDQVVLRLRERDLLLLVLVTHHASLLELAAVARDLRLLPVLLLDDGRRGGGGGGRGRSRTRLRRLGGRLHLLRAAARLLHAALLRLLRRLLVLGARLTVQLGLEGGLLLGGRRHAYELLLLLLLLLLGRLLLLLLLGGGASHGRHRADRGWHHSGGR